MVITRVPGGRTWPEFGMYLTTILANIFLHPKDLNFNQIKQFLRFLGGHKVAKILYIGLPVVTMVNIHSVYTVYGSMRSQVTGFVRRFEAA